MGIARREDDPQEWNHWIDRENHIAYVRVASFQENTVEDLDNVIRELKADGAQALILDLRDNPGGLLTSAQRMVSLFMGRGEPVVSTEGRIPGENQNYVTKFDGPHKDIPLTLLVNERSASASEIVSGAIRDNHRGVVIGERTFGKFSVQNLIPLGNSGKAKLKLTTARYYLPSGDSLHRDEGALTWGVKPDVTLRLAMKEKYRIWEMRREAERIGPAPKAFVDVEGETQGETGGDGDDDKPQEPEPELTWFTLNDKSVYDMTVKLEEDTDSFDHVEIDGRSVEALAKSLGGGEFAIKTMRIEGDQIGMLVLDPLGRRVLDMTTLPPIRLFVDGHEAVCNKLPRLVQKDENNRPRVDPQRDAALLQMRVMLLSESYPAVAAANRAEQIETATP
jgi:hypothetical protein